MEKVYVIYLQQMRLKYVSIWGGGNYSNVQTELEGKANKSEVGTIVDIAESYTDSPTNINEVIKSILTIVQPHTWTVGLYQGKFASTHSGGGDLGTWVGMYACYVAHNSSFGTSGFVVAQGYIFEFNYLSNEYAVTKSVPDTDLTANNISYTNSYSETLSLKTALDRQSYIATINDWTKESDGTFYRDVTVPYTGRYMLYLNFRPTTGGSSGLSIKFDFNTGDPLGGIPTVSQYEFACLCMPIDLVANTARRVYVNTASNITSPTLRMNIFKYD